MVDCKDRIYELMTTLGVSQSDISKKTGISKSNICQYVNGVRYPKQDKIMAIAKAYNVDPAWLTGADVPMYKKPSVSLEFDDRFNLGKFMANNMDLIESESKLNEDNLVALQRYVEFLLLQQGDSNGK